MIDTSHPLKKKYAGLSTLSLLSLINISISLCRSYNMHIALSIRDKANRWRPRVYSSCMHIAVCICAGSNPFHGWGYIDS